MSRGAQSPIAKNHPDGKNGATFNKLHLQRIIFTK